LEIYGSVTEGISILKFLHVLVDIIFLKGV